MSGAPEHIEVDVVELFTRHGASRRHARATADPQIGIPSDHAIVNDHIIARRIVDERRPLTLRLGMRVPGDGRGREQRNAKSRKDQLRVE